VLIERAGEMDMGDITLTRGGSIAGRVSLPGGLSCAGLRVGLDTGSHVHDGAIRTVGADGAFRFDLVTPGPHQLFVDGDQGRVRSGAGWDVTVVADAVADVVVDLADRVPHRIEVVVRVNGQPAEGLWLLVRRDTPRYQDSLGKTDADGRVLAETDGVGEAELIAGPSGAALGSLSVLLRSGECSHHELDIVAGRLVARLPGDQVPVIMSVERLDSPARERWGLQGSQPVEGLLDLGPVLPGHYKVSALVAGEWFDGEAVVEAGSPAEVSLVAR
jgi:hypothetical protein